MDSEAGAPTIRDYNRRSPERAGAKLTTVPSSTSISMDVVSPASRWVIPTTRNRLGIHQQLTIGQQAFGRVLCLEKLIPKPRSLVGIAETVSCGYSD